MREKRYHRGHGLTRRSRKTLRFPFRVLRLLSVSSVLALLSVPSAVVLFAQSQSTELHIRFNAGQSVVPIYEGWERVPDGSFNMVFGYLNRNHVERPSVAVGPDNGFEPGPADRGQPEVFYTRENHYIFRV